MRTISLTAFVTLACALMASAAEHEASVIVYEDIDYKGDKEDHHFEYDGNFSPCFAVVQRLRDKVSSIHIYGAAYCDVYGGTDCTLTSKIISQPGEKNLGDKGKDDEVNSYRCYHKF